MRAGSRKKWNWFLQGMKLNKKFTFIILVLVFAPIVAFTMLFFSNMEQNVIWQGEKALEYTMESSHDEIIKNVDNINMSTQFFLGDRSLLDYLGRINSGAEISYKEMMEFYDVNISALERMVNSNPYIYQIRVYVDSDNMEEMMPILYRYSRMKRLSWAQDSELGGWKFDYPDTIFDLHSQNRNRRLLSLVTPVSDYKSGQLGILEVAIRMETMFPIVYEEQEKLAAFFIDGRGGMHCSEENRENLEEFVRQNPPVSVWKDGEIFIDYRKWQGSPVLVGTRYIREFDGALVCISSLEEEIGTLHRNRNIFLTALLLLSIALVFLVNYVVKRLLFRFYQILQSIREVQKGDLNVVIADCGDDEMGELGSQINKMMERIRQLMAENLNRELLVKNSQIRALQNQINAHFIYNVLESIKMMAEIDEKYDISDAITALGKMLRYSMRWTSGTVTVGEELEYVTNYLALINLRFDYEIYLSINLPELMLHQEIPKISLQPIVENSINHGIEQLAEDTSIYVKGRLEEGDCIIEITDTGKGMTQEQLTELRRKINGEIESGGGGGNGIGLKNVQDRIRIHFGERYGLQISSKAGCYTKVQIRIPQTYFDARTQADPVAQQGLRQQTKAVEQADNGEA